MKPNNICVHRIIASAALLVALLTSPKAVAQSVDEAPLFSLVYLESGDVLIGRVSSTTDSTVTIEEWHLGSVTVPKADIDHMDIVPLNTRARVTLGDQGRYTGELKDTRDGAIVFQSDVAGEILLQRRDIQGLELLKERRHSGGNPNATRYFFAPSAIPVEKGHGYYQNAYILSNSVNFGITNHFSLGGGIIIPIIFYVTPKVSFKVANNFYLGAGLIGASTFIPGAMISGGIPYGLVTVGNENNNFTLGSGYGLVWDGNGTLQQTHYPISTVNGMIRLSSRLHLVSENWLIPVRHEEEILVKDGYYDEENDVYVDPIYDYKEVTDLYGALTLGLRIQVSERSTVDFAPVYLLGIASAPVIPYLDFVYKF